MGAEITALKTGEAGGEQHARDATKSHGGIVVNIAQVKSKLRLGA